MELRKKVSADDAFWEQKIEEYRYRNHLVLSEVVADRQPTLLNPKDFLHMMIVGASGFGKSKLLEQISRQIVQNPRNALILIDPYGDLYHSMLAYCAKRRLKDRVILIDPAEDYAIGFNVAGYSTLTLHSQIKRRVIACLKSWGQQDTQDTPRLARWLYNLFSVIIESGYTLQEAQFLVDLLPNAIRPRILAGTKNQRILREFEAFEKLPLRDRRAEMESTSNRLRLFVDNPRIRAIVSQKIRQLNLRNAIDEGKIILVNLECFQVEDPESGYLLGTLLFDDLIGTLFSRKKRERHNDTYLVIDEFSDFVTPDIGKILNKGRKYRFHAILAHQHLAQIEIEQPKVFYDVLTNTQAKVVMGGLTNKDLQILAAEFYTEQFDLDELVD